MRTPGWQIRLAISLALASLLAYTLQVSLFHRTDETLFYMLQDFAFLPLQILLVTLVLNELLARRERSLLHEKLNMVIGAFFTEIGNDLLRFLVRADTEPDEIREALRLGPHTTRDEFGRMRRHAASRNYEMDFGAAGLNELRSFLSARRDFILRLLENPNLLEHESFTDLLWAVSHLSEELAHRSELASLSETDAKHLAGDAVRAYRAIVLEWLSYVRHLQERYPYMYSLVIRTSPFEPETSAEVV